MKKSMLKQALAVLILSTLLLSVTVSLVTSKEYYYGDINKVEYVRNYDGDTITFNLPSMHPIIGEKISIRVSGVDTPEKRGKCIKEKALAVVATNFVQDKMLNAKKVRLKNIQRGKYFRIVAEVWVDGEDLSALLVESGYAVPYDGGTKSKDWCE